MVEEEIIEIMKKFKKAIEEKGIRVKKIILYGSQATRKSHKDSDIDVAVVSPDFGKDRFEEGVMLFEIASEIDPRIEPVPLSPSSYENDTWLPLIYEIREKGVELKDL
jgi:predicted nucleotidyltransferase